MGVIKRTIRNVRYGTKVHSVLITDESLMFQNVMSCSSNKGRTWCGAIVGLTNKRLLIEWQRNKGKDVAATYDQIVSWQISNKIGGLSGALCKLSKSNLTFVNICVNQQLTISVANENSTMEIFVNHLMELCPEKQK